ncbi:MAG: rsbP 3 [Acidimicrobiaceae bacterium]|nr:rsbP 3 [Acidimicrobiaceae bacterium]
MRPLSQSPTLFAPERSKGDEPSEALEAFLTALAGDDPEQLYDRAPCGYLTTLPDGLIAKVNRTFLTLTGYEHSDLIGRLRFVDLLSAGGRIYHETHYAPMLQMQGTAREIALEVLCADGRRLPVLVNSVLEHDDSGRPTVVRTAVFDASQRREYERELLRIKQRAEDSEIQAKKLARTLQQSFIPPTRPNIPGLEMATVYRPAGDGTEIGGDFYDVFEIGSADWCVVIGDVSGKGVEAAIVALLARHTVRAAAVRQTEPSAALATLNEVLLHHETNRFCTLNILRLRLGADGWTATVSCGGHPLPFLIRAPGPPVTFGKPGSLVGAFEESRFSGATVKLEAGDVIVMHTDGVTEARNQTGEFYGDGRLRTFLVDRHPSARALVDRLLDEVMLFQSQQPRDDIALVAIAVPGSPSPNF